MSLSALQSIRSKAARQAVPALARGYATPAPFALHEAANGIKVAAKDEGRPTASISIVAKAGSRYEPAPGVAHVLKNSVFKVRPTPLTPDRPLHAFRGARTAQ